MAQLMEAQRRLTPAGAGRTKTNRHPTRCTWAYPRRCGENATNDVNNTICGGLPPQVRGEPPQPKGRRAGARLTPAGAGRTWRLPLNPEMSRAYPRRCGENHCAAAWA